MDLEILHHHEMPAGPFDAFRRYIVNPKRMMQAWGERAPNVTGFLVFMTVAVELALSRRIVSGNGPGGGLVTEIFLIGGAIAFAQLVLLTAASSVANVMEKKGHPLAALCYMNLGLAPLLLMLPLTILFQALGWPGAIRALIFLFLAMRIAAHWREALQFSFRLTRLQTVFAFYGAGSATIAVLFILVYVAVFGRLAAFLNA